MDISGLIRVIALGRQRAIRWVNQAVRLDLSDRAGLIVIDRLADGSDRPEIRKRILHKPPLDENRTHFSSRHILPIIKGMEQSRLQWTLSASIAVVATCALNFWLFRQGVLWGLLGLSVTKHVLVAWLCHALGLDRTTSDPVQDGVPPDPRTSPSTSNQGPV